MHPLATLCSILVILTALLMLRFHYAVDMDDQKSNERVYPVGMSSLGGTRPKSSNGSEYSAEDFHDVYFAPLLATHRRAAQESHNVPTSLRFRSGCFPKVVMYTHTLFKMMDWYKSHVKDIEEDRCALTCTITPDISQVQTADAVLIHLASVYSPNKLLKDLGERDPLQPWIMFEPETYLKSNTLFFNDYKNLNGTFNRTMHYRRDSDIQILHGFVVQRGQEADLLPSEWRQAAQVQQEPNTYRKLAAAIISDCSDDSGRLKYITELRKYAPVDVYGECGELKCGDLRSTQQGYKVDWLHLEPCLRNAGSTYLFYLAFENALCTDYVTEDLYNLLQFPIVPVVRGAGDYSLLLPPHSYINAQDYSPQQLAHRLLHLAEHPQEYQEYLSWRQYYQPSTIGRNRMLCDLCARLYDPDLYHHQVIEDFHEWYVTKANCSASETVKTQP